MGRAYSTHNDYEKYLQNFGRKTWKDYLEDLDEDGRIMFR